LKGPFAINTSELSPTLLQWLRDDPQFTNTSIEFAGSRRGFEEGFKHEACYHTESLRTVKKVASTARQQKKRHPHGCLHGRTLSARSMQLHWTHCTRI
jgi:hypothetical protein